MKNKYVFYWPWITNHNHCENNILYTSILYVKAYFMSISNKHKFCLGNTRLKFQSRPSKIANAARNPLILLKSAKEAAEVCIITLTGIYRILMDSHLMVIFTDLWFIAELVLEHCFDIL